MTRSLRVTGGLTTGAFGVLVGWSALTWWLLPSDQFLVLMGLVLLKLTTLGNSVVMVPALDRSILVTPLVVALTITVVDLAIAMLTVGQLGLLRRLPWLGARLTALEDTAEAALVRRPWMKRLAVLGVAGFVALPLPGTGAVGGVLFGRIGGLNIGLSLLGVALGTFCASCGAAAAAETLRPWLGSTGSGWSWIWTAGLAAAAVFVIVGHPSLRSALPGVCASVRSTLLLTAGRVRSGFGAPPHPAPGPSCGSAGRSRNRRRSCGTGRACRGRLAG